MTTIAVFCLFLSMIASVAVLAGQEKKPEQGAPLDLNTATVEQLDELPGIGPTTAKAIVRFREKSGPFRRVEDLLAIRGITKKKLDKIRPLVTVKQAMETNKKKGVRLTPDAGAEAPASQMRAASLQHG